ncbi:COP1-interactive protein 1-like [Cornus florida]|uniref:COP1-interactive protein 1-like n=1 Tax=Cornus florida TaxID=4283 RepID=UPI002896A627|nr:COP1-interactive protein 1-like [Cornus florida]
MKLAKNENENEKDGTRMKNSEIAEFIQDFHRKYQSLYALYDNLRGKVREEVDGREEKKEGYSCSTSSSDSESQYSLDEIGGKTSESRSELQKVIDDLKQKLETSNLEVTNLRNKLISMGEENEALTLECMASLINIPELEKIINDLRIEAEHTENTKQKLVDESSQSKKKLEEREKELSYFTKSHQVHESEAAARIKDLESQVTCLKLELENQKKELEKQVQHKATEAKQARDQNLVLESRILDLETASKEKEDVFFALHKKFEENENSLMSKIENLMAHSNNLQMEVDTPQIQKAEFEDVCKSNEASAQVKDITDQLNVLQEEPKSVSRQKSESESNLEKQTQEISLFLVQIEHLTEKLASTTLNEQRMLEDKEGLKVDSLSSQKSEEMAEEFCKKFEDHLRPLSRRIRVAEHLLIENKDCFRKIKERFEQEHVELEERAATNEVAIMKGKDSTLTANDMLTRLDSMVQRFEHCSANFLNQISKVSCEVKFAKDWMRRKTNAIKHVKEDADCLLAQMDAKEAELFGFGARVRKLENKVRELENMVKEKEEGMLSVGEEKREAIRQLCLWIDYYRSHSDFLKKLLFEMSTVRTQRKP